MGFRSAPAVIVLCAPWLAWGAEHESLQALSTAATQARPDSKVAPSNQTATTVETARRLEAARDWPGLVACMEQRARLAALTPEEERLFASGLEQVGRMDEAAAHMDRCAVGFELSGRDKESKAAQAALRRIDPLSARRDRFLHLVSTTMLEAARDLLEDGDAERAARIARGLPRIARGKDAVAANQMLARARAAFEKVELTRTEAPAVAPQAKDAVIERETAHYRLACRLEPDVVERLGHLMDDIHAFYVRVYFDGDAKRARSAKATIRIAPDKETMLLAWEGRTGPEGWWSPGTNEVHAYDTRGTTGSLDDMLETLFHEASHQFMTLLAGGSTVPAWLNEGTSSFFEGAVALADGRVLWPRAAPRRLEALQVQIARQQPPRLRDVVLYDGPGSYPPEYYAWGWGLVYYLLEYEDPSTLRQVYRPLYAAYRSEVVQKGAPTFDLFAKWFLGERSPRNHPDFSSFERDWESWIQDEVVPLHGHGAKARALRLARIERLISAADAAESAGKKKDAIEAQEFLARARVHFEWIRTQIDKDTPDAELLLRQVDVLERLSSNSSAAALVEEVLDLADSGKFALDEERRAALEKRLAKLDHRNAALRAARKRSGELARTGLALVDDYREAGSILRAWTLAADLAAVLGEPLQTVANGLREEVRARGLLQGTLRGLSASAGAWEPLLETPLEAFETGADSALLDGVRAGATVDTSFEVTGEYVVRATLRPEGARDPGWTAGFVVAGAPEHGSTMVGLDDRGLVGIWTIDAASAGATTLRRARTISIERPVAAGTPVDLEVRVRADGTLDIRVGDRAAVDARIDVAPGGARHVGLFVRNARVTFADPRVELVP